MRIETTRRVMELPDPSAKDLRRSTGLKWLDNRRMKTALKIYEAGARAAMEAYEASRPARREEELMRGEL